MPHDINGELIQVGDFIKVKPLNQSPPKEIVGVIVDIHSQEQTCTGQVSWVDVIPHEIQRDYFAACDSELITKASD